MRWQLKFFISLLLSLAATTLQAQPQRVLSLNLCADQLLIDLLEPWRIVGLTTLSTDPELSYHYQTAARFNQHHGQLEEILSLQPDLIVAGRYTTSTTTQLLKSLGYPVYIHEVPDNIPGMYEQIRKLGEVLEVQDQAHALISRIEHQLQNIQRSYVGPRHLAAVYYANGMSMGEKSVVNDVLLLTGFDNLTAKLGIDHYSALPLEELIRAQPDLIVLGNYNPDRRSMAQQILNHRALRAYQSRTSNRDVNAIDIPDRLWMCAGPSIIEAAQILSTAHPAMTHEP